MEFKFKQWFDVEFLEDEFSTVEEQANFLETFRKIVVEHHKKLISELENCSWLKVWDHYIDEP